MPNSPLRRFVLRLMVWYDERAAAERVRRAEKASANAIRVRRKLEARRLAAYRHVHFPR